VVRGGGDPGRRAAGGADDQDVQHRARRRRGREKVALVRLRLSRTLPGAAEAQAMAAEALATGSWDVRARWFGVVICAMLRLSVLGLGITIPWRVIAAQITEQQCHGR
jgi:hypothetical protein